MESEAMMNSSSSTTAAAAMNPNTKINNQVPPFLSKTYDMVEDLVTDGIVSWSDTKNSFVVWDPPEFAKFLLPKYFKHNNFASFVRQLNTYGFRKVDPDRWEFAHEDFLSGQKHLLKHITRRKAPSVNVHQQKLQGQQTKSVEVCVEVGKFGLEEEMERLKRDKNILMQELVRLRQQQQASDNQMQTLGQRLQGMEQRQQQMMSFLAKAMQNRGFLAQLVQQQKESNRHFAGVNKKRRLPENDDISSNQNVESLNGQIIKYQPLQINTSHLQETDKSPQRVHISDAPYLSEVLDTESSANMTSSGTPPSNECDIQSSPALVANSQLPESIMGPEFENGNYNFPISDNVDETMAVETNFSPVRDVDLLLEEMSKLPSMNDAYWEDLIPLDQLASDIIDELNMSTAVDFPNAEADTMNKIGSGNSKSMDQLTHQMGLLSSEKN